ncbi:hypothetical protein MUU47_10655 [Scandinavium sp. H11S7]|uniref:Uncharacterized protein n=1 Tax=Scandinavium hiltneri TaxID=2926519 RepID=A0ABT2E115_9ENTR|nr:hypothetical protein [Scandinavium hiltneri]MCS2161571.1 hypothetical protein [Scandinavium hiltneri]
MKETLKELSTLKIKLGSDTSCKLDYLCHHHKWPVNDSSLTDPEALSLKLALCIETLFNQEMSESVPPESPVLITLPKSMKSMWIYVLYQLVITRNNKGENKNEIVNFMNKKGIPTADDIFKYKQIVHIHPQPWKVGDVSFLRDPAQVNELIGELNQRKPRSKKVQD